MRNSQKVMEIFTNRGYDVSIKNGMLTIYVEGLGFSQTVKYIDEHSNVDYLITRIQGDLKRMEQEVHVDIFKMKFLKQVATKKIDTWLNHYIRTGNDKALFPFPEKNKSVVYNILKEVIKQYVTVDIHICDIRDHEIGCDVLIRITNK